MGDLTGNYQVDQMDLVSLLDQWLHPGSPDGGLVAHWQLNETEGNIASDRIGGGYDGQLENNPLWKADKGKLGGALDFQGTGDYLRVAYDPNLNPVDFSVSFWLKPRENAGEFRTPISSSAVATEPEVFVTGYTLYITIDKKLSFFTGVGPESEGHWHTLGLTDIGRAVWTHVAATFESTSGPNVYGGYTGIKKLYLNGVEVASDAQGKYIPNRSEKLTIGKASWKDASYLEGLMDDVRLYNRALAPEEVEAIASLGTSEPGGADFNGIGGVSLSDYAMLLCHWDDSVKPIVVNEAMARNDNYMADPQGEFDDWLELYNAGVESIDVGGMYLTDNLSDPMKWQIPLGQPFSTTIEPGNYLVIWADEDVLDTGFHASFQLEADEGETIGLYDTDGTTLLDVLSFGPQARDISFGRIPDSTDNLQYMTLPSFGTSNTGPSYSGIVSDTTFTFDRGVYSVPSLLEIECGTEDATIMYTTDGTAPSLANGTEYDPQPLWAPTEGKLDGALRLDLNHNKTKVPYHAELNGPSFTVSFWSRLDADLVFSSCPVASADIGDSTNMFISGYMIVITPYEMWQFFTGTGSVSDGYWDVMNGPSVPVGIWVHVAATFEATSGPDVDGRYTGVKKFYIDGNLVEPINSSASYIPNTKTDMTFGEVSHELAGNNFYGLLDDIRIYDRALGDTEVADLANLQPGSTSGLTGHWKLDEEEGWDVSDETGNHDGRTFPGLIIDRTKIFRAGAFKPDWLTLDIDTQSYIFPWSVMYQSESTVPASAYWGHAGPDWEMDSSVTESGPFTDLNGEEFSMEESMMSAPSLSLVMNWDDMFGPDGQGIYIQGEGVERLTSAELLFPQDSPEEACQINCVVQIVGGSSPNRWKMDKLSLRLKFKEFSDQLGLSTGGPRKLRYKFFPDSEVESFDTLVLDARMNMTWAYGGSSSVNVTCYSNDLQNPWAQYTRDQFPGDLQNAMGGYAPHGRPVHLYINGVYWGMYLVHERPDATFASSYFGGEKEDYDVLKHNSSTVVGMDDDPAGAAIARSNYASLTSAANQLAGSPTQSNYENVLAWLDPDCFIDYMLVNFFIGNTDWAHQNWYASRNRVDPAGRWRYHNWDPEHCLKCVTDDVTYKDNGDGSPTDLHQDLCSADEYRIRFADRVHKHFFNGGVLTLEGVQDLYMQRLLRVDRAVVGESARWGDNRNVSPYTRGYHWLNEKDRLMDDYFVQRARRPGIDDGLVLWQLRNRGLYSSVAAPVFNIGGVYQHGGEVFEGNNELTMDNPNGSGTIYYTLDGTDPREYWTGNAIGTVYSSAVQLTQSSHVKARVLRDGTWSALNEAMYGMGPVAENLRITEIMYHPADPNIGSYTAEDFEFIELKNTGDTAIYPVFASFTKGIQFTFPSPQPNTFWDIGFDSDAEGFTYADDTFNGTSNPSYAEGSYEPSGGATGGGLRVHLGPGPTGGATSGGWSKDFALDNAGAVNVSVKYRLKISEEYEDTEYGEAILEIDGTRYGTDLNDSLVHLVGGEGGAITSTVLITEMSPDSPDYVEIQNVASIPVDTSGWVVALNDASSSNINDVHTVLWNLPSSMAANEIQYRTDSSGENYWGENIWWTGSSGSWAMIVDDVGNVVDFVVRGYSEVDIASMNVTINGFPVSGSTSWTGDSFLGSGVLARIGDSDNDVATDFENQSDSRGVQNTGLTTPFGGGVITDSGWQTGSFLIPEMSAGPHTLTLGGYNNDASAGDEDTEVFIDDIIINTFPAAVSLASGEYTVVVSNQEAFELLYGQGVNISGEYTGSLLANDGEQIVLEDALGTEIHSFEYEDGWYDITDGGGFSLTLVDPNSTDPSDWDRRGGWRTSYAWGGSPGWDDAGLQLSEDSVVINEVLSHSPSGGDWIELHNTTDNPIPIGGWFLSDDGDDLQKYEIEPGLVLASHGYVVFYEDPNFGMGSDPGMHTPFALNKYEDTVYLTSGFGGEITGLHSADEPFDAADPNVAFGRHVKSELDGGVNFVAMSENTPRTENANPLVGPIVINEIAYHPDTGDAEFVELLNISNETVILYDEDSQEPWRFVDDPKESDRELEFYFRTTPPIEMAPGEYLLLVKDRTLVEFVFNNNQPFPSELQVYEWGDGGLSNSDERPELQKPGGMINPSERAYIRVDRVSYKDDPPWPTLPDNSNVYTLQRKVASEYGNDVINWDWDDPYPTHTAGGANPSP